MLLRILFISLSLVVVNRAASQLAGNYTIGGVLPDYSTINLAVADVITNGVSGPVIFDIRPGTYVEDILFTPISGASATNTITFRSETLDSTEVTILGTGTNATSSLIYISDAGYLHFEYLTLDRASQNIHCIEDNNGTALHVKSCILVNGNLEIDGADFSEIRHNNTNNYFIYCYNSDYITVAGNTTSSLGFFVVNSSTILNNISVFQGAGLTISDCDSNEIRYNDLSKLTASISTNNANIIANNTISGNMNFHGIELRGFGNNNVIEANNISNFSYGIWLEDYDSTQIIKNYISNVGVGTSGGTNHTLIANNMISGGADSSSVISTGIWVGGYNAKVYHNSIYMNTATANTTDAGLVVFGDTMEVVNNLVVSTNPIVSCLRFNFGTNNFTSYNSNYNSYFNTTGGKVVMDSITNYYNLNDWSTASGMDLNSISDNPVFISNTDLHIVSNLTDNAGTPIGITDDIDYQLRSTVSPDVGADEFGTVPEYIPEDSKEHLITLYPNPTTGVFSVLGTIGMIKVYNHLFGRVVLETKQPQIDLSGHAPGVYMVHISGDSGVRTRKIVLR